MWTSTVWAAWFLQNGWALYVNGTVVAPCDSPIYCYGEILHQVELAQPFTDSKTFVDMPGLKPLEEIQAAFDQLDKPLRNNSQLTDFLRENFAKAGGELEPLPEDSLTTEPKLLAKVKDAVISEFVAKVIIIWPELTRRYVEQSTEEEELPNSFIPINRTFVVAGGRFREPYYWDSYWILEGLLRTGGSFIEISKNTIENFLDFVDRFGFVPNGARIYYLNRSQPPLLAQMVKLYVEHTNDTSILERAVPLLIKEHEFWMTNRTVDVEVIGENGHKTLYTLNRYHVENTQPRPESYREDYVTASNRTYFNTRGEEIPEGKSLSPEQKATLYANLASGAESGWDYTSRWLGRPEDSIEDRYFPLRSLVTMDMVPVDLNSILYANEATIGDFLEWQGNVTESEKWHEQAEKRREAVHLLLWNDTLSQYFDYNLTSHAQQVYVPAGKDALDVDTAGAPEGQQVFFSLSQFYPFWLGVARDSVTQNPSTVKKVFRRVSDYLAAYRGGIPVTNIRTGQQWDQPNVWPPLMHILTEAVRRSASVLGQDQKRRGKRSGGVGEAKAWLDVLSVRLGQRYLDATYCTWMATGGSTKETPKMAGLPEKAKGTMFEKYSSDAVNGIGSGGEYEVVEGFGWTNGVLLWVVDTFGDRLRRPQCGDLAKRMETRMETRADEVGAERPPSAVEISHHDAQWIEH